MGQSYSLTTLTAGSAGIDVPELADLTYEKSLGNARFMKTVRARHREGLVVAKVVMKPYSAFKFDPFVRILLRERRILADIPNALSYHRILETSSNGYLVRQYIHSSLYDRMSTRPFLEEIEKKWLAFQLLCAVRDCHARSVFHGDIKTENTLVTSWNWLYLADFSSSFKPTYLPEDNPADFSFYFDTSGRRTCYLAPERFLEPGKSGEGKDSINWAMDIFSVGCVIAELFLETPIFSLSQLFKYRRGEYDPSQSHLSRIADKDVQELIAHMIQVDPESRYSADEYLNFWRGKVFPEYFYSFLHQYMYLITDPSSGRNPVTSGQKNLGESDERIDRVYNDFDKIAYFLGFEDETQPKAHIPLLSEASNDLFPLFLNIPNNRHRMTTTVRRKENDGTLIFLTLIESALRSTARTSARLKALELMLAFSERLTDEAKLDRVLPYVISMLEDDSDRVRIGALRTVTQLMALVSVASPVNAYIWPEYILPRLHAFTTTPLRRPKEKEHKKASSLVRATYASCMATLALTASRFLDMMQALRAAGSLPTRDPEAEEGPATPAAIQNLFDVAREDLIAYFEMQTKLFLTDDDPAVRRAFLGSVGPLCVLFGSTKSNDVILSHLNTYLNDRDWLLKCSFFKTIVGVAAYVGGTNLEEFILPLMIQALTDPEEFVTERVLRSFSSMAALGLFQRGKLWELVDICSRFLVHPNIWIREAAAQFISASASQLSIADAHGIVIPIIKPYLKVSPSSLSELQLLDRLKKPLPRTVFDMAVSWATKVDKGVFWKPAQQHRSLATFSADDGTSLRLARDAADRLSSKTPRNEEDEQWLTKLRAIGMTTEDEAKIVGLREYIWRMAHRRKADPAEDTAQFRTVISVKDLNLQLQTVFFTDYKTLFEAQPSKPPKEDAKGHTIADALLDASTTVDDALARRRISRENSAQSRDGLTTPRPAETEPIPTTLIRPTAIQTSVAGRRDSLDSRSSTPRTATRPALNAPASATTPMASHRNGLLDSHHAVSRKGSAINLMQKSDSTKAGAEISTTSANAFGKMDGPLLKNAIEKSALALAKERQQENPTEIRYKGAHTYNGQDPNILKLLDNMYVNNYPLDDVEFGPIVVPIGSRRPIKKSNGQVSGTWHPEGTLVTTFGEHLAAISRVLVSPDHLFFITASDDGSVKVWDTARLERNIAHRSRQTHKHADGVKVTSLCFVETTHCFVSTGNDGSINVVKVDCQETPTSTKYGRLRLLRDYTLPSGDYAVWCEHFRFEGQSVLLLATTSSRIIAMDLRTMETLYTLDNPVQYGTPTTFAVDKKRHALLLGTSHGVLNLWDLRFRLLVKSWGFKGAAPIHRIAFHPLRKNKACISGGTGQGEITLWDLEKFTVREVYRTHGTKESSKGYHAWQVEDEASEGMLGRFATSLEPSASLGVARCVQGMVLGVQVPPDSDPRSTFLLSVGPDWKVRYWDMGRPEASVVISGLEIDSPKPVYSSTSPGTDPVIVTEKIPQPQQSQSASSSRGSGSQAHGIDKGKVVASNSAVKRTGQARPSRSAMISAQQQALLRSHIDSVLDVALVEVPYGMVISVDRSGVIFVFQ